MLTFGSLDKLELTMTYKIDEDLTSLNISVFNQDLPGEKEISGASATMTIKEIKIDSSDSTYVVEKDKVSEMEPNNYENLKMKQATKGGFFAKKGFNIETSPDDVKAQVDTLYFWDGARKIDLVLAFEDLENWHDNNSALTRRKTFIRNLESQGLKLELEPSRNSADNKTNFLKIHAPSELLEKYSDKLNLEYPVKRYKVHSYGSNSELVVRDYEEYGSSGGFFSTFNFNHSLIPPEPNFFSSGISLDMQDKFIEKEQGDNLTSAQRSMVVWEILSRTRFDDDHPDKRGILRLLSDDVFKAAYPLHDGRYDEDGDEEEEQSTRRILHLEWARFGCWYKKQPFSLVKRYFGEKIGLYFCWLGFYTEMLIFPAIAGLFVFFYGAATLKSSDNYPTEEICDETVVGNLTMCPRCDQNCPFWQLKQSCLLSKITYMFDNTGTVFFTIFMSFWATMFLELWKRRQAVIAWQWDLRDFDDLEESRPEFEAKVKTTRINPVTKQPEPFLSPYNKALRVIFTNSFVVLMLIMVVMIMFSIMLYRVAVVMSMYTATKGTVFSDYASLITSLTASIINLVLILIMNELYQHIALWLTNKECPRTQTEFEDSFTIKKFLFQFINYYSSLIYIAFFKGKFFNHPGDPLDTSILSRFKTDVCDPAGCTYELCIQLAIIMVGKQMMNNFLELLFPKIAIWWRRHVYQSSKVHGSGIEPSIYTRWEQDYNLQDVERLEYLDEYLEMVIQYGFVTLFVTAFPLAPFFALLNNIFEIRLDAYKYIATKRRPLAERAQDIGAWFNILRAITYLSVVSNALTIALSSDFVPHQVYRYFVSKDGTLKGYINYTLTYFNTSYWGNISSATWAGPIDYKSNPDTLPKACYFKSHRDENFALNIDFYIVLGAKLIFVIVYEHLVFCLTGIAALMVPDVPSNVRLQKGREALLVREAFFEFEMKQSELEDISSDMNKTQTHLNDDMILTDVNSSLGMLRARLKH